MESIIFASALMNQWKICPQPNRRSKNLCQAVSTCSDCLSRWASARIGSGIFVEIAFWRRCGETLRYRTECIEEDKGTIYCDYAEERIRAQCKLIFFWGGGDGFVPNI